jgi:hypothetical protein
MNRRFERYEGGKGQGVGCRRFCRARWERKDRKRGSEFWDGKPSDKKIDKRLNIGEEADHLSPCKFSSITPDPISSTKYSIKTTSRKQVLEKMKERFELAIRREEWDAEEDDEDDEGDQSVLAGMGLRQQRVRREGVESCRQRRSKEGWIHPSNNSYSALLETIT